MEILCDPDDDPRCFGARSFPVGAKGLHLWGVIASSEGAPQATYQDPTAEAQFFRECVRAGGGLWQITTTAREYRRFSDGPLLPLGDEALSQTPPGVDPATLRTVVQLRVSANDGADTREFDMDANQSIAIVAQSVCVHWLGPTGMVDVYNFTGTQRAALSRTGVVVDSFLGVSLSRIEQQPGDNSAVLLTQHLFVPEQTRGSIAIPAYAREVTIYQEPTLGTASTMWTQTLGDPNGVSGSMTLAALPFIAGLRKTQPESLLPNASHLLSDIDADFDRFFSLSFVIRP